MQRSTICAVAVAAAALGCGHDATGPTAGPAVAGSWSGSATGVSLAVTLGNDSCPSACGGVVTGGTYRDSVTGLHGTWTGGTYELQPSGSNSNSSPVTGWLFTAFALDSTNLSATVTVSGSFANPTSVVGYAKFMNSAAHNATDSVTITLVKQ